MKSCINTPSTLQWSPILFCSITKMPPPPKYKMNCLVLSSCEKAQGVWTLMQTTVSNIRKTNHGTMRWIGDTDAADASCKLKQNHTSMGSQRCQEPFCHICALVGRQCQPNPCAVMSFTRTSSVSHFLTIIIFVTNISYIWMCIISKCCLVWNLLPRQIQHSFIFHRANILCSSVELLLEAVDIAIGHFVYLYHSKPGQFLNRIFHHKTVWTHSMVWMSRW